MNNPYLEYLLRDEHIPEEMFETLESYTAILGDPDSIDFEDEEITLAWHRNEKILEIRVDLEGWTTIDRYKIENTLANKIDRDEFSEGFNIFSYLDWLDSDVESIS